MYDIRQFKPTLYAVLLLGCTGFALATGTPGLWLLVVMGAGLHAWLTRTGRFRPLPRWLATAVTVLAMAYVVAQLLTRAEPAVVLIGEFLVLMHLIKLYELRGNRDYAQLLVLSLLLTVAAAISPSGGSLMFGVLLLAYVVLSLYCCLLFHLKVENERAGQAMPVPPDQVSPSTLRQDQLYLPRSMRRLTGLISLVSVVTAIVVFLFFPRGAGGILGQWQSEQRQTQTGFSDQISFDRLTQIQQSNEVVAHIFLWKDDQPVRGSAVLLRLTALDKYGGGTAQAERQWTRSTHATAVNESAAEQWLPVRSARGGPPGWPIWRQKIDLQLTGQKWLFCLPGVSSVKADRTLGVTFCPWDQSLHVERITEPMVYEVLSSNRLDDPAVLPAENELIESDPQAREQVRKIAMEIPGVAELVGSRPQTVRRQAQDGQIAQKMETWLRRNFTYTLDLSDVKAARDEDRLVMFLTRTRRGHCEYFAGSMALMCQSLGIPARVATGFKCDEFSNVGDYYIVRQSHAHAWVEVLTADGWQTFDPTSGREAPVGRVKAIWQSMKHLMDFMEYKWSERVIAYDRNTRADLVSWMDSKLTQSIISSSQVWPKLLQWLRNQEITIVWALVIGAIGLMLALAVVAIVWFSVQQYLLRRRAARMGIRALPMDDQLRLARQLGFYDELTQLLARRGILRPAHLTPLEFSGSLNYLPGEAYAAIARLTRLMYRVRFGEANLPPGRQRRLVAAVERLAEMLPAPGSPARLASAH